MAKAKTLFKPGYCLNCGKQAMVTDHKGKPIKGLVGSRECWLGLTDDQGIIKTRIGQVHICKECDFAALNCDELLDNLRHSPFSGVPKDIPELGNLPGKKLELIRRFGD